MIQKLVSRGLSETARFAFSLFDASIRGPFFFLKLSASAPVSFTNAEGKGEVGGYFFKVLQRNVTILVLVVIFHDGLRGGNGGGGGRRALEREKKDTTRVGSALV